MARTARARIGWQRPPFLAAAVAAVLGVLSAPACAPSSLRGRSIAEPLDGPDGIVAIGRAGDVVYALTRSHQLRTWNLRTRELRTLARSGAIGIARDGAVALSASETMIEAWEPTSGRRIATHRFANGIRTTHGVSPAAAYIVAKRPPIHWPSNAAAAPPPDAEFVSWDLASGTIEVLNVYACDDLGLSVDGARTLCDSVWRDRPSGVVRPLPHPAPEWAPPEPEPEPPRCVKCGAHVPETGYSMLSAWLSADGRTAYVTYRRTVGGEEWRLDRWIPDASGETDGRLEHLAVSHEPIADRVVAASHDGRIVLTNPGLRPPILRHAPGYEGVPLLAPPVTAAAFSQDERRIVTGHGDGRLRLWDANSGNFERISDE